MGTGGQPYQPNAGGVAGALQGVRNVIGQNQDLIVPFLHGIGSMASSNSRYLGSAMLQGLAGAADSYENTQNEMINRGLTGAQIGETGARTGLIGAQTGLTGAETQRVMTGNAELQQLMAQKDLFKGPNGAPLVEVADGQGGVKFIPYGQWVQLGRPATAHSAGMGMVGAPAPKIPNQPSVAPLSLGGNFPTLAASNANDVQTAGITQLSQTPQIYDPFTPASARAADARQNTVQTLTMAHSLSELSPGHSGRFSADILNPLTQYANNLAASLGIPQSQYINNQMAAQEVSNKISTWLASAATQQAGGRAYQELAQFQHAIPSEWNSKEGQSQLVAALMGAQQRTRTKMLPISNIEIMCRGNMA